ncbi:BA75_01662T0 [Komagataella pastoris]|uniref:26S proteasome regulatory subunit RPN8 n=1 Tax=Komagataella pastoris TaxID=4922 RepID=A0A1B2J6P6_PICPA|nr:BA75_01662T0 [Komagataella pastoris]
MPTVVTNESSLLQTTVSVAPLVLLSVVDHYERVVQAPNAPTDSNDKRVVGVILGDNTNKNLIKVTNSFAIPFEEDEKNKDIWFLDHDFIESMMEMFKKINAKERLIGWYHSGPKLKSSDLQINELFKRFTPNPLLLIVDVNSTDIVDIPTDSYLAIEEIKDDGSSAEKTFIHLPSIIQAEEAEEIGVEHLLRDIRDQACGNLSIRLTNNFKSLKSLNDRIGNIVQYLRKILSGELPINNVILGKLQDIFNLLPNLVAVQGDPTKPATASANQLATSFNVKTNDELMMVYISSLVRSILAFHDLIDNKIENKKNNEKEKEFTPTEEEPQQASAIESK